MTGHSGKYSKILTIFHEVLISFHAVCLVLNALHHEADETSDLWSLC
jgi:hypothetical protein